MAEQKDERFWVITGFSLQVLDVSIEITSLEVELLVLQILFIIPGPVNKNRIYKC